MTGQLSSTTVATTLAKVGTRATTQVTEVATTQTVAEAIAVVSLLLPATGTRTRTGPATASPTSPTGTDPPGAPTTSIRIPLLHPRRPVSIQELENSEVAPETTRLVAFPTPLTNTE